MAEPNFIERAFNVLERRESSHRFNFYMADNPIKTEGKKPAIVFDTNPKHFILSIDEYLSIKISFGSKIGYVEDVFIPSYYNTNLAMVLKFRREKSTYHSKKFPTALYLLKVKCLVGKQVETYILSTLTEETRTTFIALYNLLKIKSRGLKYIKNTQEGNKIRDICNEYSIIATEYKRSCNHYGLEIKKVEYIINKLCNILVDQEIANEKELANNRYKAASEEALQLDEKVEGYSFFTSKTKREGNYAIGVAKSNLASALKNMADLEAETADKLSDLKNSADGSNKKLIEYKEKLAEEELNVNRKLNDSRMEAILEIDKVAAQWNSNPNTATAGVGNKLTAEFKDEIMEQRNLSTRILKIFGKDTVSINEFMDKEISDVFKRSPPESEEKAYKFVDSVLTYIENLVKNGMPLMEALDNTKKLFRDDATPEKVLKIINPEMQVQTEEGGSSKSRKAKKRKSRKNKKSRSRTRKNRSFKKNNKKKNTKKRR